MAFKRMFSYAKVDVPNRSGHNVDHRHAFSAKCGTLIPSFSDFLIPGDTVDLSPKFSVQMAPQATDFIGRISLRTELFYVPLRAIWGGWKDFITYASEGIGGPAPEDPNYHAKYMPGAIFDSNLYTSLLDYSLSTVRPMSSNNPTFASTTAPSDTEWQQKVSDITSSTLINYQTLVEDSYDSIFTSNVSAANVGPGSLADYLGFKVAQENKYAGFFTKENLLAAYTFFESKLPEYISQATSQNSTFKIEFPIGSFKVVLYVDAQWTTGNQSYRVLFSMIYIDYGTDASQFQINNILKLVAYHKIYDDWYRDARLMKKLFPNALGDNPQNLLGNIAYITKYGGGFTKKYYQGNQLKFYDGKSLFDLRQRLWQKDFFTTMTQAPQSGDAMKVQVTPDSDNPAISGEFTISSLRLANAMQLWRERNNLVDSRYGDVQYAQYGVYPSDAVTDRAIYLGSNTVEIYNKSVYQQGAYEGPSNNPIKGIGTKYATPVGVGQGSLCNNYSVTEHGILMALTSIVPEPSYSSGTRRDFHYNTIDDIAFPLLQGVGDQPVYAREIIDTYSGEGDKTVIGYTGRYSEYKFINDHISGLLRDGQSLSAFALQRSFTEPPVLGAEFLEIPEDYLDQVSAVGVENSKYGAWIESYWRYSKVSCLSEYNSVPTLGRMPDVHQITVTKAGSRL